jgi:hypothetical protein
MAMPMDFQDYDASGSAFGQHNVNEDETHSQSDGDSGNDDIDEDDTDYTYRPDVDDESDSEPDEDGCDVPHPNTTPQTSSRFADMDVHELSEYIDKQKNRNTARKTKGHMKIFDQFLESKNVTLATHLLPPTRINELLSLFFVTVRKEKPEAEGTKGNSPPDLDYEPAYLKGIQSSIERYLKEKRYQYSIVHGKEFFESREAISSRCKELKKDGKGGRPNRKRAPTTSEMQEMWSSGGLGGSDPQSLQQTLWWIMCTRFGLRANKENYSLRWGDVKLKSNASGTKYLTLNERDSKTRQGNDCANIRSTIKVFADPDNIDNCPVQLYEKFQSKRPAEMCTATSNFYLQPKIFSTNSKVEKEPIWYKRQVINKFT